MDTETLLSMKRGYLEKPWLRRDETCKAIVSGAGVGAYLLMLVGGRLAGFSENEIFRACMAVVMVIGFLVFVSAFCSFALSPLPAQFTREQLITREKGWRDGDS